MPDGPVAQLDRASDYESEGRMFESCRVHHTLITEAEYLTTTYRPDCDYIRGELQERNVGQKDHSIFQGNFLVWFHARRSQLGLRAFVELRVRVAAGRYRIPDVCVVRLPAPDEQILTSPPYIMIEVYRMFGFWIPKPGEAGMLRPRGTLKREMRCCELQIARSLCRLPI